MCFRNRPIKPGEDTTIQYSLFRGNEATEYGKSMESNIETEMKWRLAGVEIGYPSLHAHTIHKFMAGSPDGIACSNGERFLLEYKAPYSLYIAKKFVAEAICLIDDISGQRTLR